MSATEAIFTAGTMCENIVQDSDLKALLYFFLAVAYSCFLKYVFPEFLIKRATSLDFSF